MLRENECVGKEIERGECKVRQGQATSFLCIMKVMNLNLASSLLNRCEDNKERRYICC